VFSGPAAEFAATLKTSWPSANPQTADAGFDSKLHQVARPRQLFSAKIDLFPGRMARKKFHAPDADRRKQRLRIFGIARGRGDTGRLRECFGQDDAGNQPDFGKMTGEDRIFRGKRCRRFRENTGITLDQLAHEKQTAGDAANQRVES